MKTIKYILALFVLTMSVGCRDLKREDYTQIYEENFYQTENDLKLAVNGLYAAFRTGYGWDQVYHPGISGWQSFTEMSTDVAWCGWGGDWDEMHFMQWSATNNTGFSTVIYYAFARYNSLSTQRNTIRRIQKSPVPEQIRNLYEAEARGTRGWMSLYLFDYFGTVPVASDEVLDNPTNRTPLARATVEEWDKMVEEDLRFAIQYLPEVQSERGRLTKGAARMILLKYYMVRKDFVKAEAVARDLLAQEGIYGLMPTYEEIFTKEKMGNKEIILQIPTNNPNQPNLFCSHVIPDNMPWTANSATWGAYVIPWDFYDTFEAKDLRRKQICTEYITTTGEKEVRGKNKLALGAIPLKYGKDPDFSGENCAIDIVVYRFSDVLLSVAELATRNTQAVSSESIGLVNRVRNRAGLDNLTAEQTASAEAFLEAILAERGHELWFEGFRRQDLIRYGKYVEYGNKRVQRANAGLYPGITKAANYNAVPEYYDKYYIPSTFITESRDKIVQNPGYVN